MNYFSPTLGINHIPNFLRASTPSRLRKKILINNKRLKAYIEYMGAPQWVESEGLWYIWFRETEDFNSLEKVLAVKDDVKQEGEE